VIDTPFAPYHSTKRNKNTLFNKKTVDNLNISDKKLFLHSLKGKIMYAIVEIAGQQFKAESGKKLYVHRLAGNEGDKITFDKVLLTDADGTVKVGAPTVSGAAVNATIIKHLKGDKVIVFKKKRRKGYKKLNGHRQSFTQISIESIA
jgi:large subunit ribosomal protein L21